MFFASQLAPTTCGVTTKVEVEAGLTEGEASLKVEACGRRDGF